MPSAQANRAAVLAALPLAAVSLKHRKEREATAPDYTSRPAAWINERLGEHLWSKQIEIATALAEHRRVAVHSAHDTGKSFLAARLVAWWIDSRPAGEAFVVTTAPTAPQVRAILWREINRAHRKGNLRGSTNQTEWWLNEEMVAFGRKPADYDPTAFQGIHARYVLVVIDEACGVPESIYHAAGSLAANQHSRILAIGNPDDPHSHFATICRPDSGWQVIHVDGLASPNFTDEPIPDELRDLLLSRTYAEELASDAGGEESAVYQSKVRGRFAADAPGGVVPLSAVRACQRPEEGETAAEPVELGMDVGAGGDETVVRERRGKRAGRTWKDRTPEVGQAVDIALRALRETGARTIKIDTVGVGWGAAGRLKELRIAGEHSAEVVAVNVGSAASEPERFPKLRDELWWTVGRELTLSGGWNLEALNEATVAQLTAPTYVRDAANRIHVEAKADTKKRLHRSPDDADALLLAFYSPPSRDTWFV